MEDWFLVWVRALCSILDYEAKKPTIHRSELGIKENGQFRAKTARAVSEFVD